MQHEESEWLQQCILRISPNNSFSRCDSQIAVNVAGRRRSNTQRLIFALGPLITDSKDGHHGAIYSVYEKQRKLYIMFDN